MLMVADYSALLRELAIGSVTPLCSVSSPSARLLRFAP
jgi:hypothetical protein